MKICCLGNSHVGMIKLGYDRYPDQFKGCDIDFFAATRERLSSLKLNDGVLSTKEPVAVRQIALTSGGRSEIRLADYDAFVVVALGYGLYNTISAFRRHRLAHWPKSRYLISPAVMRAACKGTVADSAAANLIRKILSDRKAPIVLCAQPKPRETVKNQIAIWRDIHHFGEEIIPCYEKDSADLAQELGITILQQPKPTEHGLYYTKNEFGAGALQLGTNAPRADDEPRHMNPIFGRDYLALALQSLKAA